MYLYQLHILCEGHSEEAFVENKLEKFFETKEISVDYSLITTSKSKNIKGGNTDYNKIKGDILKLLENPNNIVTTFVDYYRLPQNFPQYNNCKSAYLSAYEIKKCLENAFKMDIQSERFIPYIQLHEFETLIFADISNLDLNNKQKLSSILSKFSNNPELINSNNPPSQRISEIIDGYKNAKSRESARIMQNINIDNIRQSCKGFNEWIENILKTFENLSKK